MLASQIGPVEAVMALLAKGADVSAKTADGLTAIDYARRGGHDEIEAVLKKAGPR
jgi:ankyrin repeat protein